MIDTDFEQRCEAFRVFVKVPLNVLLSPTHTIQTMQHKTIIEWLYLAKEQGYEWADAAIENCDAKVSDENMRSLEYALLNAFYWDETPQGDAFWSDIHKQIQNNNQ